MSYLVAALIAVCLTGCASTRKVNQELSVLNEPGVFSLRLATMDDISHRRRFEWINAMGKATVRQDSKVRSGIARIEVRDAAGFVVLSKSLSPKGSFATAAGKPGIWTILLALDHATGSVAFTVKH